jgi:hypothetical protein
MASGPIPFTQWAKKQHPPNPAQSNALSRDDFIAHSPNHTYIYLPTGEVWTSEAVNSRVSPIAIPGRAKPMPASRWIDRNNAVEQRTWSPGDPQIIEGRVIVEGGWTAKDRARIYNSYRPPTIIPTSGDVTLWLDLVEKTYPGDSVHIIRWCAFVVQHPGVKINHAILLGGLPGIGKDTILQPLVRAVGAWNAAEISPAEMLGTFNPFKRAVFLRISEGKDQGEHSRYEFYERCKTLFAAPPETILINEKFVPQYYIPNCVNCAITTNHKISGIYLPADDRRHYVAWTRIVSPSVDLPAVWRFYDSGGIEAVAGYLLRYDLGSFDPKAPPPKTEAFWEIAHSMRPSEEGDMGAIIERLGNPATLIIKDLIGEAAGDTENYFDFGQFLRTSKNARLIALQLEKNGYRPVRNPRSTQGLWLIRKHRTNIYVRSDIDDEAALNLAHRRKDVDSDAGGQDRI